MRILLWWLFFTALCIWVQAVLPGVDCFGPALLVVIHLHRYKEAVWLAPLWIMINEGAGTLAFGMSVLWFGGLVVLFVALGQYLSSKNLLFLLALSVLAGVWQTAVVWLMTALQELSVPHGQLVLKGTNTAVLFPVLWIGMHAALTRWGQVRYVPS